MKQTAAAVRMTNEYQKLVKEIHLKQATSNKTSQDTLSVEFYNSQMQKSSSKNLMNPSVDMTNQSMHQNQELLPPLMKAKGIFKNKHIDVLIQQINQNSKGIEYKSVLQTQLKLNQQKHYQQQQGSHRYHEQRGHKKRFATLSSDYGIQGAQQEKEFLQGPIVTNSAQLKFQSLQASQQSSRDQTLNSSKLNIKRRFIQSQSPNNIPGTGTSNSLVNHQIISNKQSAATRFRIDPISMRNSIADKNKLIPYSQNEDFLNRTALSNTFDDCKSNRIKINKAYKLNYNNFSDLQANVRPTQSNYLFSKMRRQEAHYQESKMNKYADEQIALIKSMKDKQSALHTPASHKNIISIDFNKSTFANYNDNKTSLNPMNLSFQSPIHSVPKTQPTNFDRLNKEQMRLRFKDLQIEHRDSNVFSNLQSADHLSQCSPGLQSMDDSILNQKYSQSKLFTNKKVIEEEIPERAIKNKKHDQNIQSNMYSVRSSVQRMRETSNIIASKKFDFDALNVQRNSISQNRMQELNMQTIKNRRKQDEKDLFVINKKPKSTVLNSKTSQSKQVVKLSHGDQFRGIDELTKIINSRQTSKDSERIIKDRLNIQINTSELKQDPDSIMENQTHINNQTKNQLSLKVQPNINMMKLKIQQKKQNKLEFINVDSQEMLKFKNQISIGTQIMSESGDSPNKIKIQDQNDQIQPIFSQQSSVNYDQHYSQPNLQIQPDEQAYNDYNTSSKQFEIQQNQVEQDTTKVQQERTKNVIGLQIQAQNIDLEKIKEDSAESFMDTNTMMIIQGQSPNEQKMMSNLKFINQDIIDDNDLNQKFEIYPQNEDSSYVDEPKMRVQINSRTSEKESQKLTPTRVILQKKQFTFNSEHYIKNEYNKQPQQIPTTQLLYNNNMINGQHLNGSHQSSIDSKEERVTRMDLSTYRNTNENLVTDQSPNLHFQLENKNIIQQNKISAEVKRKQNPGQEKVPRKSSQFAKQQRNHGSMPQKHQEKNISSFQIRMKEDIDNDTLHEMILEKINEKSKGVFDSTVTTQRGDNKRSTGQFSPQSNVNLNFGVKYHWKDSKPQTSNPGKRMKNYLYQINNNSSIINDSKLPLGRTLSSRTGEAIKKCDQCQQLTLQCTCMRTQRNISQQFRVSPINDFLQNSRVGLMNQNQQMNLSNHALQYQSRKSSINSSVVASIERPVVDIKIKESLKQVVSALSQMNDLTNKQTSKLLREEENFEYHQNMGKTQNQFQNRIQSSIKLNAQSSLMIGKPSSVGGQDLSELDQQFKFPNNYDLQQKKIQVNFNNKQDYSQKIRKGIASPIKKITRKIDSQTERMTYQMPTSVLEEQEKFKSQMEKLKQRDFGIMGQKAQIRKIVTTSPNINDINTIRQTTQ
eukprot:403353405